MSNFTPAWFKKGFFNESLFCDDFLSTHQLLYSNGAFFPPDGRMVSHEMELPYSRVLIDRLLSNTPVSLAQLAAGTHRGIRRGKQALWKNDALLQIFIWFCSSHTFVFIGGLALGVEQSVHKSSKLFILRFTGA